MAVAKYDPLHLPYKDFKNARSEMIRNAITKAGPGTVTADVLEQVLTDIGNVQSEDYRQDWLEVERWSERFRDNIGSLFQVPPTPDAVFYRDRWATVGGQFGDIGYNLEEWWTMPVCEDSVQYYLSGYDEFNLGQYGIVAGDPPGGGIFQITHEYHYEVNQGATTMPEDVVWHVTYNIRGQQGYNDANLGPGYDLKPRPQFVEGTGNTRVVIEGKVSFTTCTQWLGNVSTWSTWTRLGIMNGQHPTVVNWSRVHVERWPCIVSP